MTSTGTPTATPKNPGGVTPTMVKGIPSMRTGLTDSRRITAEPSLPGRVTQDRDGLRVGSGSTRVGRREEPPGRGTHSKSLVHAAGGEQDRRGLWLTRPLRLEPLRRPREDARQHVSSLAHLLEDRKREGWIAHGDELARLLDRQGTHDYRVDEREDRRHGAEPAPQGNERSQRQARMPGELPPRKPDVVPQGIEKHGQAYGKPCADPLSR